MSEKDAFDVLKSRFTSYVKNEVLTHVNCDNLDLYYIGLPTSDFEDFDRIIQLITSGDLLHKMAKLEADEALLKM